MYKFGVQCALCIFPNNCWKKFIFPKRFIICLYIRLFSSYFSFNIQVFSRVTNVKSKDLWYSERIKYFMEKCLLFMTIKWFKYTINSILMTWHASHDIDNHGAISRYIDCFRKLLLARIIFERNDKRDSSSILF